MPENKGSGSKSVDGVLQQNHYPSSVDNMMRDDRPYEGTATSLPSGGLNPAFGADGKLPVKKISKLVG